MPENKNNAPLTFILPGVTAPPSASRSLGPVTRGGGRANALLDSMVVKQHVDLSPTSRAAASGGKDVRLEASVDDILALEMADGFIYYTSAQRLADDLERVAPTAVEDGAVRLDALRGRGPISRGLGDWLVRALSVVGFKKNALEQEITDAAAQKAKAWLGDKAGETVEKGASWAATKALMWAIEKRLERQPGLYRWVDQDGEPGDLQMVKKADFADWKPGHPILVFIHGTASSTLGSFGDLGDATSAREWDALFAKYGKHIYAFEHRTFSESPIENALLLAGRLPAGAHLSVVTHSRGGLVGDLLCLDSLGKRLADDFTRNRKAFEAADELDRNHLMAFTGELAQKKFHIERYVRVASPAQGTLLAGAHLDAFLSALLHLIGLVPFLQASPTYAVAKRIILQIVKNRTDPRLVPGIEAMLPDSPLAALIGQAQPKEGAEIGVIAGDIQGGHLLKRIGVFLTDFIFFEEENNDLVVDTDSMYGGLARERGHYLFDQGADVNHFRYFANARTRHALQVWLTEKTPVDSHLFLPIQPTPQPTRVRSAPTGSRAVLFFLPGIMGSHLRSGDKDRVWFDFFDIARGGMKKIRYDRRNITIYPDGLFNRFYGDLCEFLGGSHEVRRFAYDWRQPLRDEAHRLAAEVVKTLNTTDVPVRIMAHSMGGLVVRMMMASHPDVWNRLVKRQGARFIMLGTPNHGSHQMVETLLGTSDTIRKLAVLDGKHSLQQLLDLVADYPGALQLLPHPEFKDTGESGHDYYDPRVWENFKRINDDFWFGKNLGAKLSKESLDQVKQSWILLKEELPGVEKIAYVAGYGQRTPCGIELDPKGKRLRMIGTLDGDGTVTHASGLLDDLVENARVWYMNADHGSLTRIEETFPALLDLLEQGETSRLSQTKPLVRGSEQIFRYDAGPVLYPTKESLALSLIGGRQPLRRRGRDAYSLNISCRAMDLRYVVHPILVGHYEGDPIAGAEAQIDHTLVNGALTQRYHMGMYAGKPGTTTVVLPTVNEELMLAGVRRGAVVVGFGRYGDLGVSRLGEAVREGVLRYLLQVWDLEGARLSQEKVPGELHLATLLLGYNSTTNISIADSVHAIVRGVMEANRQFTEAMQYPLRVVHLEFVELFLDVAISAAGEIRRLSGRLEREAQKMGCHLAPASTLISGKGVQQRLEAISGSSYWPRLSITDADRSDVFCPAECTQKPRLSSGLEKPYPPEYLNKTDKQVESAPLLPTHPRRRLELARKLRFMYLSQRARAETEVHQRQPGLVETLVENSIRDSSYKPDLSHTLFQLLVPHDFKEAARQTEHLLLVVDGYTANLPWEMLAANDEPLIVKTAIVRQFSTSRYRRHVRNTLDKAAFVVGNPSTQGYYTAFPDADRPDADGLDPLPGAEKEAVAVMSSLASKGYDVVAALSGATGDDVINKLFMKPFRIIHISAHGVFQAGEGADARSGVVLSSGLLLTAAEIGQLEVVPDLVFLNCCFLGQMDSGPAPAYNRLAHSLARELIEIGVRAVVVAGWAVRDDAAEYFAATFYHGLLHDQQSFGEAIHKARRLTYHDPRFNGCNTWGAYQAYGDPGFILDPSIGGSRAKGLVDPVAIEVLVAAINRIFDDVPHAGSHTGHLRRQLKGLLKRAPRQWQKMPEILYACGRCYGELGDFTNAIHYLSRAVAMADKKGRVPVKAVEQLANFEARKGSDKDNPIELIQSAIARLHNLTQAAGGTDADGNVTGMAVNSERCALLGSAYKRLAGKLNVWSMESDEPHLPQGIRQALALSAQWYAAGEGILHQPNFNAYNAQNRIALQAVLGTATFEDVKIARYAGQRGRERYVKSCEFWDMIMAGDGELIAGMIDESLMKAPKNEGEFDAARAIIDRYTELINQLPKSMRELDSVVKQILLLKNFVQKRAVAEKRKAPKLEILAQNLARIAAALEPTTAAGEGGAAAESSCGDHGGKSSPGRAGQGRSKKAKPKAALKTKGRSSK